MAQRINARPYPPRATPLIGRNGKVSDAWLTYFTHLGDYVGQLIQRGTRALQPAATSCHPGTIYFITDEDKTERSNGNEWEDFTDAGGGGGAGGDLEYLGDYVAAPQVYNDGDIVVGPDGIAYLCTKNGVTTPPEPWPGVGISSSVGPPGPPGPPGPKGDPAVAINDATYWTSTGHTGLVNERAMNVLANGYVKNSFGEPYTIAGIPVAEGGTGASNATDARTNLGIGNVGTVNFNGNGAYFLAGDAAWRIPAGVPSGMIGVFMTACPAGWTRVAGWDGRFLRAMPTYGYAGGSGTHTHGLGTMAANGHTHGAAGLVMPPHNHGGTAYGGTDAQGDHAHDGVVNGTTGLDDGPHFVADSGSSGTTTKPHSHNVNIGFATNGAGVHSHNVSVGIGMEGDVAIQGATASNWAPLVGAMDAADHYPYFIDVVFCQKD